MPKQTQIEHHIAEIKAWFPALEAASQEGAVMLDAPGGTQIAMPVLERMREFYVTSNSNTGGGFATSRRCDDMLLRVREKTRVFLGASDDACVIFGPNMTSLAFALSRTLSLSWKAGDEILVSKLDHNANIDPWRLAAEDRQVKVTELPLNADHSDLDYEQIYDALKQPRRIRLMAITLASNLLGTVTEPHLKPLIQRARELGVMVVVDGVHYSPHRLPDFGGLGCDFFLASPYKFFGPHLGVLCARRAVLEPLVRYKVRPAYDGLPSSFETGTPNLEGIAGLEGVFDYFERLAVLLGAPSGSTLREHLAFAYQNIHEHEQRLNELVLQGLEGLQGLKVLGHDLQRMDQRVPTFALYQDHKDQGQASKSASLDLPRLLAEEGIYAYEGDCYAKNLFEALPEGKRRGLFRVGFVHYHSLQEASRTVEVLRSLV